MGHFACFSQVFDVVDEAGAQIDEGEASFPGAQPDSADVDDAGLGDRIRIMGFERNGNNLPSADGHFAPAAQADSTGGEIDDIAQRAGNDVGGKAGVAALVDQSLGSRFGSAEKSEHTSAKSAFPLLPLMRKAPPQNCR